MLQYSSSYSYNFLQRTGLFDLLSCELCECPCDISLYLGMEYEMHCAMIGKNTSVSVYILVCHEMQSLLLLLRWYFVVEGDKDIKFQSITFFLSIHITSET